MKNQLIYIKESDIPITRFRKTFIRNLIMGEGAITYLDKECTKIQCDKKNAYRSISELHCIIKSRFPLTSLKALIAILKELIEEDKRIAMVWCTQINKVVIKYVKNTPTNYGMTSYSREKYYKTKGVDGYSLKDYEDIYKSL